jgi:hypothetical protein
MSEEMFKKALTGEFTWHDVEWLYQNGYLVDKIVEPQLGSEAYTVIKTFSINGREYRPNDVLMY